MSLLIGVISFLCIGAAFGDYKLSSTTLSQLTLVNGYSMYNPNFPATVNLEPLDDGTGQYFSPAKAIWGLHPQNLVKSHGAFNTTFTFLVTSTNSGTTPADGFAFVLQNQGHLAGDSGDDLGYDIFNRSVTVRFDAFTNPEDSDPSSPYIALELNGAKLYSEAVAAELYDFRNLALTCFISYDTTNFKVSLNGVLVLSAPINLTNALNLTAVYAGFTAATGDKTEGCAISNWTFHAPTTSIVLSAKTGISQLTLIDPLVCGPYTAASGLPLSCDGEDTVNAAWITAKQLVLTSFQTSINYSISYNPTIGPADGFALIIQNQALTVGRPGGYLGTDIFSNSVAVCFSTSHTISDSIFVRPNGGGSPDLVTVYPGALEGNHTVIVAYAGHHLSVILDHHLLFNLTVDISSYLGVTEDTKVWVGIVGATGLYDENLYVKNWSLTSGCATGMAKCGTVCFTTATQKCCPGSKIKAKSAKC